MAAPFNNGRSPRPHDANASVGLRTSSTLRDTARHEDVQVDPNTMTAREFLEHQLGLAERVLKEHNQKTLELFADRHDAPSFLEARLNTLLQENRSLKETLSAMRTVTFATNIDGEEKVPKGPSKPVNFMVPEPIQAPPVLGLPGSIQHESEVDDGGDKVSMILDDRSVSKDRGSLSKGDLKRQSLHSLSASLEADERFVLLPAWAERRKATQRWSDKRIGSYTSKSVAGLRNLFAKTSNNRTASAASAKEEDIDEDPAIEELTKRDVIEDHTVCARCMIHPYDPKKGVWDFMSLLLVCFDVFYIPLSFFPLGRGFFIDMMKWVTRIFWSIDFPLSFFVGSVTPDGRIMMRQKVIALRYLRTWFVLDVIVVGVDWLEYIVEGAGVLSFARFGKSSRILRILRMVRLLRLARMKEVLDNIMEKMNSERLVIIMDIAKLLCFMLGSGHIIACMWYMASTTNMERNWVLEKELDNPGLYIRADCDEEKAIIDTRTEENPCGRVPQLYIMSLRWAITQFAGGMDEVTPVDIVEHIVAAIVFMICYWSGAVFVGILTSSMTQLYILSSQTSVHLTVLRRYLKQNSISKSLALRVTRNAQYAMQERSKATPEAAVELVSVVSEPLRVELHYEMFGPILNMHPFFNHFIQECPHVMRRVCHTSMSVSGISKGDVIFNHGEIPKKPRMFIITAGELTYTVPDEKDKELDIEQDAVVRTASQNEASKKIDYKKKTTALRGGSWLCEPTLWVSWVHRGVLTAKEYTRLYSMDAVEFQAIATSFEYQHSGFNPVHYAVEFMNELNDLEPHEVLDLPLPSQMSECKGIYNPDEQKSTAIAFHRSGSRIEPGNRTKGFFGKFRLSRGLSRSPPTSPLSRGQSQSQRQSVNLQQRKPRAAFWEGAPEEAEEENSATDDDDDAKVKHGDEDTDKGTPQEFLRDIDDGNPMHRESQKSVLMSPKMVNGGGINGAGHNRFGAQVGTANQDDASWRVSPQRTAELSWARELIDEEQLV